MRKTRRSRGREAAEEKLRELREVETMKRRSSSSLARGSLTSADGGNPSQPCNPSLTSTSGPRVQEVKQLLRSKLEGLLPETTVEEVENVVDQHPLWVGANFSTLATLLEEYFPKELARDVAVALEACKLSSWQAKR